MKELEALLEKATEAVRRDLNHIFESVSARKLDKDSSRDLVAYTKLLSDIAKRADERGDATEDALASATEEELKALAKDILTKT